MDVCDKFSYSHLLDRAFPMFFFCLRVFFGDLQFLKDFRFTPKLKVAREATV